MKSQKNKGLFEGAGIIVKMPGGQVEDCDKAIVETAHARELSNLLHQLGKIFEGEIDFYNKYDFYGALAYAAIRSISESGSLEDLREAVIQKAWKFARELGAHLYYAYGSNMDESQMTERCPDAVLIGTATLNEHVFALDSASVATVKEASGSVVEGCLWLISRRDEASLDSYEGVHYGCYNKKMLTVHSAYGACRALVYVSNRAPHDGKTYRSGYLTKIVESARSFGFSEEYVSMLEGL